MKVKKSKITNVEMLPSWSNSYGTFHPHKVTFENGDIAITNKTKENSFSVGQELEYEIVGQDNRGNNKFKEIKEEKSFSGGKKFQNSNAAFALSYAKDLGIAHVGNGKDFGAKEIMAVAEVFNKWLNENS